MQSSIRKYVVVAFLLDAVGGFSKPGWSQLIPLELEVRKIAGIGVVFLPDYEGSDDYTLGAAPFFRYTFSGREQ